MQKGKENMAVRPPDFPDLFRAPGGAQCLGGHTALPRWAGSMQKGKDGSLVQRELSANAD